MSVWRRLQKRDNTVKQIEFFNLSVTTGGPKVCDRTRAHVAPEEMSHRRVWHSAETPSNNKFMIGSRLALADGRAFLLTTSFTHMPKWIARKMVISNRAVLRRVLAITDTSYLWMRMNEYASRRNMGSQRTATRY